MQINRTFIQLVPFIFVFLWSTGFIAAKYALPFIEPFYLLFIRMSVTIAVFMLLCVVFKAKLPSAIQSGHQIVTGLLVHGAYLGGVFAAIKWGMPAGITAIIVGIQPLLTALLGWVSMGARLKPVQWAGLGLGLAGVISVLLTTGQQASVTINAASLGAAITALLGISVGTLYQKRFGANVNLLAGSVWQYIGAALFTGILAFSFETRTAVWDPQLIYALVWLVFGLSVTAILLLMYMIREGETAKVASYFYLVPPMTAIEAWLLFNERLSFISIGAIGITVLGVYLVVKE